MINSKKILFATALFSLTDLAHADSTKNIPTASFSEQVNAPDHPYASVSAQHVPLDLAPYGYTEKEYFMKGKANIYAYEGQQASGPVKVVAPQLDYVNRILVRAPSDPTQFSGNVIVEILNNQLGSDIPATWSQSYHHFVHNGDIWIGITATADRGVGALKRFSASRYAQLSWPAWDNACSSNGEDGGALYDMVTALGDAVRGNSSDPAQNPLAGYNTKYLYLTGYSLGARMVHTYMNAIATDSHLFDGYVPIAGFVREPINSCGAGPSLDSIQDPPVSTTSAIMQVQTPSEPNAFAQLSLGLVKVPQASDGDAADHRYRYYELAGSSHLDQTLYDNEPNDEDVGKAGGLVINIERMKNECYHPVVVGIASAISEARLSTFNESIPYDAIWRNMEDWVRDGTPPPHADPITTFDYFNFTGGWRSPDIDLASSLYLPGSPPAVVWAALRQAANGTEIGEMELCFGAGGEVPYPPLLNQWKANYPTAEIYKKAYLNDVDKLEAGRYITDYDAEYLRNHWQDSYNK